MSPLVEYDSIARSDMVLDVALKEFPIRFHRINRSNILVLRIFRVVRWRLMTRRTLQKQALPDITDMIFADRLPQI
ncbi:hypothetical protein WBP07_20270 (plasmid) [Novosphingobium sp. BL-8A]|uniref:hypothetical protein n=1 Tax=Novosphingobium sp. BL-8A TaxID=3127639 RepID=UPI003756483A